MGLKAIEEGNQSDIPCLGILFRESFSYQMLLQTWKIMRSWKRLLTQRRQIGGPTLGKTSSPCSLSRRRSQATGVWLSKEHVWTKYRRVHTHLYLPLELDTRCYPNFPTAQFRRPCAECYGPFQNSTWPFPRSYQGGFSSGGQGDWLLSAATGSSDSGMPDWQDAIFQSMHWMSTSTISLLGSATWGNLYRLEPALAASIALLMSKTWYKQVCTSMSNVYTMYIHVQDVPQERWGHEPWREESAWAFSCGHPSSLHPPCHQCKCRGNEQHTPVTRWSLRCRPRQLQSGLPNVSTLPRDGQQ